MIGWLAVPVIVTALVIALVMGRRKVNDKFNGQTYRWIDNQWVRVK
jgi:hypothetical protein